ncbi:MAG: hypothetical protein V1827_02610 [Candidatus Micrarchaeota archaeon]
MDLEAELLKSLTKDQLEERIGGAVSSFHGLLTREVAVRLIAKEMGLLKSEDKTFRLGEIPRAQKRVCFCADVRKVWPTALYPSGKRSRVVEVEDGTGYKPLVLWNDDVDLAKGLRAKDAISVKGAYEKGGELHLGYSGNLEVTSKAAFSDLSGLEDGEGIHLRGVVSSIEGRDTFVRGGRTVPGFSFMLTDGKAERRCVIIEGLGRADRLERGDEIIIENADAKNGGVEIDSHARMLSRRAKDMLIGKISALECVGDGLAVEVGGKKAAFGREGALRFLGVQAAGDISLSTVVQLKKDELINSKIAVKLGQIEGRS